MSTFERELIHLCMAECVRVQGDQSASSQTTHIIASTLATSIALLMGGNEQGAIAVATVLAEELPGMTSRRAASFRENFGPPPGRPQ